MIHDQNGDVDLTFDWFDATRFYLSPWWDQVYNFGCQFYHREQQQNPWCQHLHFRKNIFRALGGGGLLESRSHEQEVVLADIHRSGGDNVLQYASYDRGKRILALPNFCGPPA